VAMPGPARRRIHRSAGAKRTAGRLPQTPVNDG
jgi:hypothetical protein